MAKEKNSGGSVEEKRRGKDGIISAKLRQPLPVRNKLVSKSIIFLTGGTSLDKKGAARGTLNKLCLSQETRMRLSH